ncbi:hypothetical protein HG530_014640 [Fusarium avenaceum]|nr:hypothetical protein HG530_014640 [Fusarium avenaceum]
MDRDSYSTQQLEAQAGTDQPPIRLGDDPIMCSHCNAPHTGFLSYFHYQMTLLVPHTVTIDFIAFPALRDVLIQDDSLYLDADPVAFACFERDFTEN